MSDAFVNQVTLDCLLNKHQYEKYISKKISKDVDKKEKKFYRKRILNLTNDLLTSETEVTNLLPDVKYAFDNYIRTCIHSFKVLDSNDIIQSEYETIKKLEQTSEQKLNEDCINDENDVDKTTENENGEETLDNKEEECEKGKNVKDQQYADNILVRSNIRIINPSLDSFIRVKMPQMREEIILPKQKEINLNEPSLKTKGIENKYIEKKKNISNIYEDNTKK
jgi:hypothetical protein